MGVIPVRAVLPWMLMRVFPEIPMELHTDSNTNCVSFNCGPVAVRDVPVDPVTPAALFNVKAVAVDAVHVNVPLLAKSAPLNPVTMNVSPTNALPAPFVIVPA